MELPLVLSTNMGHAAQMVAAMISGAGMGYVLQRAGFDRANNMASIFYGRDFRVMRVIFTTILTSMLGLYFLDLAGVMPIGNVGLLPTFFWPQLVGGAILGFGFIIGGYCPGTSVVSSMSGKIDAMFFVAGLFVGGLLLTMSYSALETFHNSGAMGRILVHEYLGIPSGVMVLGVMLFAVGSLFAVTRIEAVVRVRVGLDGEGADR